MADDGKKKKKKGVTAEVGGMKIKVKAKKAAKPKGDKKGKKSDHGTLETLAKLAESPIVADIIAVGATAAVAALAERGLSKNKASGHAVKNAGKAAAAAIGRRLMEEFDAVKEAAKDGPKSA
jgi:hypothetical protein